MTISIVQTKTGTATSASSLTLTLASGTTAGHSLIVVGGEFKSAGSGGPQPIIGVTLGGTGLNLADQWEDSNSAVCSECWVLDNIAGSQTSVAISYLGSNTDIAAAAIEVAGLNAAGSLDNTWHAQDNDFTTSSSWSSGSTGTLNQASEIAFGVSVLQGTSCSITGPSSPWSNTTLSISTTFKVIFGNNIVSANTALSYAGTSSASGTGNGSSLIATFKAAQPLGAAHLVVGQAVNRAAYY